VKLALVLLLLSSALGHVREVDFEPHPGALVAPELAFRESRLGDYFGRTPIVLVLGYAGCVNLCGTTLTGVSQALRESGLRADRDYTALFVSIDPRDEKVAPERRAGWYFLTGAAPAASVAKAVGFKYYYEENSGQFAHPAGFVLLTPQGAVSRYFPGVRFDAQELRRGIGEAARGKTTSAFERLLLVCFHDPVSGKYTQAVLIALRFAVAAFVVAAAFLAWRFLR
jgi:protein SCO1